MAAKTLFILHRKPAEPIMAFIHMQFEMLSPTKAIHMPCSSKMFALEQSLHALFPWESGCAAE